MFKFMKSKKGFTLVELMIVVVIMAILVAVAVPIFSAVTENARFKTCAGNRREIVSQVNSYMMGSVDGQQHTTIDSFTITSEGNKGTAANDTQDAFLAKLFQDLPYCPIEGAEYSVSVSNGVVLVVCNAHTGEDGEELEKEEEITVEEEEEEEEEKA